jgi:hypothetical protein
MKRVSSTPTPTPGKAAYARATWRTAQVMADKSASLMDRYRAAEAEQRAAREAEAELEAGI